MNLNQQDEFSRRQFMRRMAQATLSVTIAPLIGSHVASAADFTPTRPRAARSVIFLMMSGGMSHLDTFDVMGKKKDVMGETEAIPTSVTGIQLSKNLPKTAKMMHHIALFNGMNTTQGAHEQGQYLMERSYVMRGTIVHPAIGSWVVRLGGKRNGNLPGFVAVSTDPNNASGGFMGAKFSGVPIGEPGQGLQDSMKPGSVSESDFNKRLSLADALNKQFHTQVSHASIREHANLYNDALRLMKCEDLKAFDVKQEPTEVKDLYGPSRFGQGCMLARRLVEHGVRYVQVTLGGWDTHYDNFTAVAARAKELDGGLAALLQDLHRRGMLQDTLVALGTEFGRTPEIVTEHENGRDHFPQAFTCLMAGGGIKGGTIYGRKDDRGARVTENMTSPQDFNATIAHALGLPVDQVVISPSGRPFTIADKGKPVAELFS